MQAGHSPLYFNEELVGQLDWQQGFLGGKCPYFGDLPDGQKRVVLSEQQSFLR